MKGLLNSDMSCVVLLLSGYLESKHYNHASCSWLLKLFNRLFSNNENCTVWITSGGNGNDIASAFTKLLEIVVSENEFTDLITWSDSCVPQNRNSLI